MRYDIKSYHIEINLHLNQDEYKDSKALPYNTVIFLELELEITD